MNNNLSYLLKLKRQRRLSVDNTITMIIFLVLGVFFAMPLPIAGFGYATIIQPNTVFDELTKVIVFALTFDVGFKCVFSKSSIAELCALKLLPIPKYELYPELINTRYEVGNLLTFNISITRGDKNKINSNEEQKELGFLHSNNYFNYYNEEIMIIIIDKDKNRVNYHEKVKFEYLNEEKKIEYSMLVENNGKNNFGIYLFSISYPGIVINKDMSIEIKEENNLLNNFIKNREKEVLSLEEFEESYGILNNDRIEGNEKREIHDHED